MEQTLIISQSFEPLKVVDWQRAMTLWAQDKAEIIETHDREVRSVKFTFRLPSVVRLLHPVRMKRRPVVQFTRANIYARDGFACQYCGVGDEPENLTFDHVIPVAQGGRRSWTNIVTACKKCNANKADRTPQEAGMELLSAPRRPMVMSPSMKIGKRTPANWQQYLYN